MGVLGSQTVQIAMHGVGVTAFRFELDGEVFDAEVGGTRWRMVWSRSLVMAWSPPSTWTWVVIMMSRGSTAQMWRSCTFFTPWIDSMVAATSAGLKPGGVDSSKTSSDSLKSGQARA